jgi:hypothetical protein
MSCANESFEMEDVVGQISKVDRLESEVSKEKDRIVRLKGRL